MNAEVIIVGGGVIGTACAYFLSRRGVKVLLLERDHLGAGASGTTAALISISGTSGTPEALHRLNIQDFDQPLEIIQGGALYAAMNEQEIRDIKPAYEEVCELGIDAQWMKGSEARDFEPLLGPNVEAAFYNPASYHVNPFRLYEGYLDTALRRGSRVEYGVQVQEVKLKDKRIDRIATTKGEYRAEWVVVAGGAWTPEILSSLGMEIPIVPARGQVILTAGTGTGHPHRTLFFKNGTCNIVSRSSIHQANRQW
jgi:glycine/D-amino acid oxidase-like deaminating enzyme